MTWAACGGGESSTDAGAGAANAAPLARLRSPVRALVGQGAVLDGAASYDADGVIVEYRFIFGDGSPQALLALPGTTHAYMAPGVYDLRFTVKDDGGATAEVARKIEVVTDMAGYGCTADAGCEPFLEECGDGVCYYVGGSSGCASAADCSDGFACTDGVCRPARD